MTAKTGDGRQSYSATRTYMPSPQQYGRGRRMGRAAYEKGGFLEDTSLPVGEALTERYEIPVPAPGDGAGRQGSETVEVTAKLWYLPGGKRDASAVLWREESRKITVP